MRLHPNLSAGPLTRGAAPYLFLAPALVFGVIFFALPLVGLLYLSFTNWNSLAPPRWVGFANYAYLFARDPVFLKTLANTFLFTLGAVGVGVPASLVLARSFSRSRFQSIWRSIYALPMVTNVVAVGFIWWFVLADPWGILNRGLALVGIAGPAWLNDPSIAMVSVIMVFIWMHLGQNMLLFSAGLGAIDESLHEAARIDGAGETRIFWAITLPLLRPMILFVLVTSTITAVSYFALILVLTEGGPVNSTNVTALYVYGMAFTDLRLGRASAAAYVLLTVIFLISLLQLRALRRGGLETYG
ncbi:MAG: sugar ABC transporter permease [Microvirga sp.]